MSTPIKRPNAKVNINGVNVNYESVNLRYAINKLASFTVNAQVPKKGFLGIGDIIGTASDAQSVFLNAIEGLNTQIELSDGDGSCSMEGFITSASIQSSSLNGSVSISISGVSEDGFASGFDPSVYNQCLVSEQDLNSYSKLIYNQIAHWAELGMDQHIGSSVADRIKQACEFAIKKGQPQATINEISAKVMQVVLQNNKNCWKYLKAILDRSSKTSKVLNGALKDDLCVSSINNALATSFFNGGGNGFTAISDIICPIFLLHYIPSLKDGKGYIKTYDFDPEKITQNISANKHTINLSTGMTESQFLPLKQLIVSSAGNATQMAYNSAIYASPNLTAVGAYPEQAKGFGAIRNIEPPSFLREWAVVLTKEEAKTSTVSKMNSTARSDTQKQEMSKQKGKSKKANKSVKECLTEYAKQKYFQLKYGTSSSSISCPANVGADLKLGEITSFSGTCSGLLDSVSHTFNHGGVCSTTYSLSQVRIGGN